MRTNRPEWGRPGRLPTAPRRHRRRFRPSARTSTADLAAPSFLRHAVETGDGGYIRARTATVPGHRPSPECPATARRRGRRAGGDVADIEAAGSRRRGDAVGDAGMTARPAAPYRNQVRSLAAAGHGFAQHTGTRVRPRSAATSRRNRICPTRVFRALRRGPARTGRTRHASNPRSACPTARSRRWPGSGAERAGPGGCGYTNRWRPR